MEILRELCRILLLLLLPSCQSIASPSIQSQVSNVSRSARGEWSKYPIASFRRLTIRPGYPRSARHGIHFKPWDLSDCPTMGNAVTLVMGFHPDMRSRVWYFWYHHP